MIQQSHFWVQIQRNPNQHLREAAALSVHCNIIYSAQKVETHAPTHARGGGYYSALKRRIFCHCRQRGWVWRAFTVKQTRQRKTNSVWYHLYVELFKERTSKLTESKIKQWLLMGWEHGGTGEMLVKGCKPTVTRWVGSENLMCSAVTDLRNSVLCA